MMIDYTDAMGNVVKREEVGKATRNDQAEKWFKAPDGSYKSFPAGTEVPSGFTPISTESGGLTDNQKFNQDVKLAGIDQMMTTLKDGAGNDIDDPNQLEGYAQIYNQNNPTHQWIKVPGYDSPAMEWGLDQDPRWVKLPKDSGAVLKMPADTVISRDDKTGKEVTVGIIKEYAKRVNSTPEALLKHFGIIQ